MFFSHTARGLGQGWGSGHQNHFFACLVKPDLCPTHPSYRQELACVDFLLVISSTCKYDKFAKLKVRLAWAASLRPQASSV